MKKKLLPQDFSDYIVQREGVSKDDADAFVRAFFEVVEQGLLEDKFVKIKGFGTFKLVAVSERESININTGERFQISGHTKVSFTPDTAMKDLVNRPFAHFETVDLSDETDTMEFDSIDQEMKAEEEETETVLDDAEEEDSDNPEVDNEETETEERDDESDGNEEEPEEDSTNGGEDTEVEVSFVLPPDDGTEASDANTENMTDEKTNQEETTEQDTTVRPTPIVSVHQEEGQPQQTTTARIKVEEVDEEVENSNSPKESETPDTDESTEPQEKNDEDIIVTAPQPITASESGCTSNTMGFSYCEVPSRRKTNWWKRIVIVLIVLLLMGVCYFAGYYKVLCPQLSNCPFKQEQSAQTAAPVAVDTLKPTTSTVPSQEAQTKNQVQDSTLVVAETKDSISSKVEKENVNVEATHTTTENAQKPQTEKAEKTKITSAASKVQQAENRPKTHKVKVGDNLYKISRKYYGNNQHVQQIIEYNNLKNADNIVLGMTLKLP